MIPILAQRASHSSIECVVRITERPERVLEIKFHMNLLDTGSIPVEGSSKNTIGGPPTKAIPMKFEV